MTFKVQHTIQAALALAIGFAASPGHADQGSLHLLGVNPGMLEVVNNGVEYTSLKTNGDINISASFTYKTGVNGRIKRWEVWPEFYYGFPTQSVPGTWFYNVSESYPQGDRPKGLNEVVQMEVPAHALEVAAVTSCQDMAASLGADGLSLNEIFSQDRTAIFEITLDHSIELTGLNSNLIFEGTGRHDLAVKCSRYTLPGRAIIGDVLAPEPATPGYQAEGASASQPGSRGTTRAPQLRLRIGG